MTLKFVQQTPETVRGLIREILDIADLKPPLRAAINRLASNEEMGELWSKRVPPTLLGKEDALIREAILAYHRAISLKPPVKKRLKKLDEFWRDRAEPITDPAELAAYKDRFRITPLTYGMIATLARTLRDDLTKIPSFERTRWAQVWPGDSEMTFDRLVSTIAAVATCCDQMDREAHEVETMLNLPEPPLKRGGTTAPQVYFDRIMKSFFRRECGRPHAGIVATLEQVVFDLLDGVDESTVLKR